MMPTSARRQVQPVDVDERVQRRRGDQPAAVEALGEGDPAEDRARPQGPDRSRAENDGGRSVSGARRPAYATAQHEPDQARQRDRRLAAEPVGERPADRAPRWPPAAARPDAEEADDPAADPRPGTSRPTGGGRYGPLSDRLSQKTIETAIMTGALANDGEDAAARPRRPPGSAPAGCRDRGPTRPAKAPSRLATNGAAARAASPIGSSRRAVHRQPAGRVRGSGRPGRATSSPHPRRRRGLAPAARRVRARRS